MLRVTAASLSVLSARQLSEWISRIPLIMTNLHTGDGGQIKRPVCKERTILYTIPSAYIPPRTGDKTHERSNPYFIVACVSSLSPRSTHPIGGDRKTHHSPLPLLDLVFHECRHAYQTASSHRPPNVRASVHNDPWSSQRVDRCGSSTGVLDPTWGPSSISCNVTDGHSQGCRLTWVR